MGDIADFMLSLRNGESEELDNYSRRRAGGISRDYYSRIAAWCRNCGVSYKKLHPLVRVTARSAREDGWEIRKEGKGYIWLCPRCRAMCDFKNQEENING